MLSLRSFSDRPVTGLIVCFLLSALFFGFGSPVQADSESEVEELGGNTQRVTLTQAVEPSFHIEPIVHRFEARRGTTIPFKFEIRSTGKAMNVNVVPVRLRQELSGIILHDELGGVPEELVIHSPTEFKLAPGETAYIEGEVTVPLAKSNFLSFGVLVRDNGQASAGDNSGDAQAISAAVRFVTQYVLRVDIETGVKDLSEMDKLVFEQGTILSEAGMPVAATIISNPTNFAFECNVRGTVHSVNATKPRPFRMSMLSRKTLADEEERHLIRIMPHSRLQLGSPMGETVFPGEQTLKLEVTNGRRTLANRDFDFTVSSGDFPALEVGQAYLDSELSVTPAQIEIGNVDRAKRSCNLRFSNNSVEEKNVRAELVDFSGNPIKGVRLSSDQFKVRAGRTKTIRAAVDSRSSAKQTINGIVRLQVASEDGSDVRTSELPIVVSVGNPNSADVEFGELQSLVKDGVTSFRFKVSNKGDGYMPVHAELEVADGSGHAMKLADGYGKWLRPGETRELRFIPAGALPSGKYQLKLHVEASDDVEPFDQTLIVDL